MTGDHNRKVENRFDKTEAVKEPKVAGNAFIANKCALQKVLSTIEWQRQCASGQQPRNDLAQQQG
jgi:hypothetical protein